MSKYICQLCGYTYDDAVEGVPFDELPDDWTCPLCGAAKELFEKAEEPTPLGEIDGKAFRAFSYGLFVVTANNGEKDNGCIANTAFQLTTAPPRIAVSLNKLGFTHDIVKQTGSFNISLLSEETPFRVFEHFGMQSGRNVDKFADCASQLRSANGLLYLPKYACAFISGKIISSVDCGTHTLFVADVAEAQVLSAAPPATYAYYFSNIKPKPAPTQKKGFVCKTCGYVFEGETLPPDFICPICKHGAEDFEPLG